jgi:hypothetical protein
MNIGEEKLVTLICRKRGSRLRINILSPGYNHEANCQFPRAIRKEGRKYTVPASDISFVESRSRKFFYTVKKSRIKIIGELEEQYAEEKKETKIVIFEDKDEVECAICMVNEKSIVFSPCGHFYVCGTCATKLGWKCPICRGDIEKIVDRSQIQM